jgi:hypothetical protein
MTKFKPGDRVRWTKVYFSLPSEIYTVTAASELTVQVKEIPKGSYDTECFELVEDEQPKERD